MFGSICKDASLKKTLQATVILHGQHLSELSNSFIFYTTPFK